jgi:hypothetical protein
MTRRGIREMKHKRILFGDLGYTPNQNPYSPAGIRKMSDTWIDPDGDGYVSMVPGYTSQATLTGDIKGLATTKHGETTWHWAYTIDSGLSNELWRFKPIDGTGAIDETSVLTFTGAGGSPGFTGKIPMYSFTDANTDRAYAFTGSSGSGAAIGGYYDNSDASTGTIGLDRPNIITGDDTGAAATSATGAGGGTAVKGVVKYFVSYAGQDGNEEGALSLEFGEFDAGDGDDVLLSNLPTLSTNKRRLYRTFKDGDQPFYLATLNSSDTSYTDNIADADLGDLPLKMGDPPDNGFKYSAATWHYGRGYILGTNNYTGEQRIFFSDPTEPESFYTSEFGNWFNVYDGSPGKVLARIPAGLVLLKARAAYLLAGRTPADLTLQELAPQANGIWSIGCGAPGSARETPKGLFFYDSLNFSVWAVSPGGQVQNIAEPVRNDFRSSDLMDVSGNNEYTPSVHVNYLPESGILVVSNAGNYTTNQSMWLFDTNSGKWIGKASWAPSGMIPSVDGLNGKWTTFGFFKFDNGTAISSPTVGAPTFTGDDPTVEKTFHYVDLLMKGEASKSVTVNWFVDGATTADGTATVTLTGTDSRERHRVYINERGREIDIDTVLDNSSVSHGIYGIIYGYTDDTSVVQS